MIIKNNDIDNRNIKNRRNKNKNILVICNRTNTTNSTAEKQK